MTTPCRCPVFSLCLIAALSLAPLACSKDKDEAEEGAGDAGLIAPALDAATDEDAGPDAGETEEDAGPDAGKDEEDAGPDAGGTEEDADPIVPPELPYTGCDLMEFAPENRSDQGQEYADLFLSVPAGYSPYFEYVQEKTWFQGGVPSDPAAIWRADALTLARWWFDGETPAWQPGVYPLTGVDLDPLNCELCVELNTSNMDAVPPTNELFYPEEATVTVTAVELRWRGILKGTVSGRFKESKGTRTWCVNGLPFETTFDVPCNAIKDCPADAAACDYATQQSAYKTCQAAAE